MTRKKIGLALSGGGARGFSHLGVLKVENVVAEPGVEQLGFAIVERDEESAAAGIVLDGHGAPSRGFLRG